MEENKKKEVSTAELEQSKKDLKESLEKLKTDIANMKSSGPSLLSMLTVVFVTLKLCGVISWSWWWVLAPVWIPLAIVFALLFIVLIIAFVAMCIECASDKDMVDNPAPAKPYESTSTVDVNVNKVATEANKTDIDNTPSETVKPKRKRRSKKNKDGNTDSTGDTTPTENAESAK